MNTFTKFDVLGAALSELSFARVTFAMNRRDDASVFYEVFVLDSIESCSLGYGDTPSDALSGALARHAEKQAQRVEDAAGKAAA